MKCELYNHNGTIIYRTNTVEKMNEFMSNDGADYNIINIENFGNDIRIDFESGLQLFIIVGDK